MLSFWRLSFQSISARKLENDVRLFGYRIPKSLEIVNGRLAIHGRVSQQFSCRDIEISQEGGLHCNVASLSIVSRGDNELTRYLVKFALPYQTNRMLPRVFHTFLKPVIRSRLERSDLECKQYSPSQHSPTKLRCQVISQSPSESEILPDVVCSFVNNMYLNHTW